MTHLLGVSVADWARERADECAFRKDEESQIFKTLGRVRLSFRSLFGHGGKMFGQFGFI